MKSLFNQRHAFHLVDPSVMPLITSISSLTLLVGATMYMNGYLGGFETMLFGLFSLLTCMFL
jgi:hypothetical protein